MGKSVPEPTPPKETSAAQTGTSIATAIANAMLGNPSENTPWGSTSVTRSGSYDFTEPFTGMTYDIPTFTRNTVLSPEGQAINSQNMAAQLNLSKIANKQSAFLSDYLGMPFDPDYSYTLDTSAATPESRRWVSTAGSAVPSAAPSAAASVGAFNAGTFKPMTRQEWDADFQKKWPEYSKGFPNDGGVYLPQTTQGMYEEYVRAERANFERSERDRYTDWAMQQGGAAGAAASASTDAGAGGYWETVPGSPGKWVATKKTGSDALQPWSAMGNENYEESRRRVEDALYSRIEPQLGRDRESLETRLAGQGIRLGTEAYDRAIDEFNRQSTDARMRTVLAGGKEQSRLFGMDLQRAGFNNNLRLQQLQEALTRRNQPLNEIIGLLSGTQITPPTFMGANMPTIPTTDNAGIIQNYDAQKLQAAQMENQMMGQVLGGLFGGIGNIVGGLKLSDDDAKKDMEPLAELDDDGTHLWAFRYRGENDNGPKHIGLMASEVEEVAPQAVHMGADGFRRVDYGEAMGSILKVA